MILLLLVLLCLMPASGAAETYLNLIATADGNTVFVQVRNRFDATNWFRLDAAGASITASAIQDRVADINDAGTIIAATFYAQRACGVAGSSCFLRPLCWATFTIRGEGMNTANMGRQTVLRLDRSGRLASINQTEVCSGLGVTLTVPLQGLHETTTLNRLAASPPDIMPAARIGRRIITSTARTLVLRGSRLLWLDPLVATPLPQTKDAVEAVPDASGENVVYVEQSNRELHWITGGTDFALGLRGSAPALRDDGNILWYLDEEGALIRYDGRTNIAQPLAPGPYRQFVPGGPALFAISADDRVVRIDTATGEEQEWLAHFVEISGHDGEQASLMMMCPIACYPEMPLGGIRLYPATRVTLRGSFPGAGWRVVLAGTDRELQIFSETEALFEVPFVMPFGPQIFEIYHPRHPLRWSMSAWRF